MREAPLHPNENERLAALLSYDVLDTEDEAVFDELTQLASDICGSSISLISLIDHNRQWFKSRVGLDATETDRSIAFCSHAILEKGVFQINNAVEDERFHDNPLVQGDPNIRFYAGAPLTTPSGYPIGTLCVIDPSPKQLTSNQESALMTLANQVISQLELRVKNHHLEKLNAINENIFAVLAHDLRSPFNAILGLSKRLVKQFEKLSPDRLKESIYSLMSSSTQVYQVVDELLQWSQHIRGNVQCQPEVLDLHALTAEVLELLNEIAMVKRVRFANNIPTDASALGDKAIVKSVIRNLTANAIKYSPENSEIIFRFDIRDNQAEISIRDFGQGVPKNLQSQLFTQDVESGCGTHGEKGNGLGLMLCQQFLKLQGSRIWLDHTVDHGACFIFNLPLSNQ